MNYRTRYSKKTVSREEVERIREAFFQAAGPTLRLLIDLMETLPNVAFTLKDAKGRLVHTNPYNVMISGWRTMYDMVGYTSEELYPPDQAAVYAGRDREVFETGVPIVNRVFGFVANRLTDLNCVTVRPVVGTDGTRIGTATVYFRAQAKMQVANWYDPIRQAITYLNDHYKEKVPIERLALMSNYSVAQFRKHFRKLTQMSPSDYIARVRVNAAQTLLATTDKLITDIAAETGFYDHSHFIRTFRLLTGMTPAKYRSQRMGLG